MLVLTYSFVVMLGSDRTRRQHTSQQIATADWQEHLSMKIIQSSPTASSVYHQSCLPWSHSIKKCWSCYTEALVIFQWPHHKLQRLVVNITPRRTTLWPCSPNNLTLILRMTPSEAPSSVLKKLLVRPVRRPTCVMYLDSGTPHFT